MPTHLRTSRVHPRSFVPVTLIEQQARAAAQAGESLDHACPYPFDSDAGMHFKATHQQALQAGATPEEPHA